MTDRFNRYIVECKSEWLWMGHNCWNGFNRYIVECKYEYEPTILVSLAEI